MANQSPIETYYYIADWTDEVTPCQPTLEGWAQWLSKPDPDWGRHEAVADGREFTASVMVILRNLTATFSDGQWSCEDPPPETRDIFVRHGDETSGWTADDSAFFAPSFGEEPDQEGARSRMIEAITNAWFNVDEGETCFVACTAWQGEVRLRFNTTNDGPRLYVLGPVGRA